MIVAANLCEYVNAIGDSCVVVPTLHEGQKDAIYCRWVWHEMLRCAGAMAEAGDEDAEEGSFMSDVENHEGAEEHIMAAKRRAGLSKWLRASTPPRISSLATCLLAATW